MTAQPAPPRTSTLDGIRAELLSGVTAPDDHLLTELAASSAFLAFEVEIAAATLARVLPATLEDPRRAVAVARVFHDLATLGSVLVKRVEGALTTAATLRVQRRLHDGAAK